MKAQMLKAVMVKPNQRAEIAYINTSLESMQRVVGGLIQVLYPFEEEIAIICNDEAKLLHMPPNRGLIMDGQVVDIICGDFFVVGCSNNNFCSLTDEQAEKYKQQYLFPEKFMLINGEVKVAKYEVF